MDKTEKLAAYTRVAQIIMFAGLALICLALFWVVKENLRQPDLDIAVLHPESMHFIPEFQMTDYDHKPFDKNRLNGKWTFLFIGYTLCPDICPTTLHTMHELNVALKKNGKNDDIQFVFISVDPERDSLERIKSYVQYFDPSFVGVTSSVEQLRAFADAIGANYYQVPHPDEPRFYYVIHSAEIFLINPKGELYALFPPPHQVERIAADFSVITRFNNGESQSFFAGL